MSSGLRAIDPGLFTTVQDLGRSGYREWGVPSAGAFDTRSAKVANKLLGNDANAAVLEATLSGGVFQSECRLAIAIAGAGIHAAVLGLDGQSRPFLAPGCRTIEAGEKLILGRIHGGARVYLAVYGGWQTPLRLGSRSTETRIQSGELIPTNGADRTIATRYLKEWGWVEPKSQPIRIIDGPDSSADGEGKPGWWEAREWRVDAKSSRMGLRLNGPVIEIATRQGAERLSTPVAPGAIQWAGGSPMILGVACGTMGGYPHIGHVISADLARLGQLCPGDVVRFYRVGIQEARELDAVSRREERSFLARIEALVGDRVLTD